MLINKFHSSKSNYVWSLKTKDGFVYIENKEKNKVLELINGYYYGERELSEEDFFEDNHRQLWEKAKPDGESEGYFFLGSSENAKKVLSATSASALKIRSM